MQNDRFCDLKKFSSLQILGISANEADVSKIIPYLSSKFNRDKFKKMQIRVNFEYSFQKFQLGRGQD